MADKSQPITREFFQGKIEGYKPFITLSNIHLQKNNKSVINKRDNDGFN